MERKEALKLLAKAIKQRQPDPSPPVDLSTLPALPDLRIHPTPYLQQPKPHINPESSNPGAFSLDRRGLNYTSDNLQAQLTPDKIQAQISIRDALVKALYKDGNSSVSASTPLLGGNLDIGIGNNSYNVKFQKDF